jgi:hypothetical protein
VGRGAINDYASGEVAGIEIGIGLLFLGRHLVDLIPEDASDGRDQLRQRLGLRFAFFSEPSRALVRLADDLSCYQAAISGLLIHMTPLETGRLITNAPDGRGGVIQERYRPSNANTIQERQKEGGVLERLRNNKWEPTGR